MYNGPQGDLCDNSICYGNVNEPTGPQPIGSPQNIKKTTRSKLQRNRRNLQESRKYKKLANSIKNILNEQGGPGPGGVTNYQCGTGSCNFINECESNDCCYGCVDTGFSLGPQGEIWLVAADMQGDLGTEAGCEEAGAWVLGMGLVDEQPTGPDGSPVIPLGVPVIDQWYSNPEEAPCGDQFPDELGDVIGPDPIQPAEGCMDPTMFFDAFEGDIPYMCAPDNICHGMYSGNTTDGDPNNDWHTIGVDPYDNINEEWDLCDCCCFSGVGKHKICVLNGTVAGNNSL